LFDILLPPAKVLSFFDQRFGSNPTALDTAFGKSFPRGLFRLVD
jgi:hypothetical protein